MMNLFVMVNMQILSKHGPTFYGGATRCLEGENPADRLLIVKIKKNGRTRSQSGV